MAMETAPERSQLERAAPKMFEALVALYEAHELGDPPPGCRAEKLHEAALREAMGDAEFDEWLESQYDD